MLCHFSHMLRLIWQKYAIAAHLHHALRLMFVGLEIYWNWVLATWWLLVCCTERVTKYFWSPPLASPASLSSPNQRKSLTHTDLELALQT